MNSVDTQDSKLDIVKWLGVAALVAAAASVNLYLGEQPILYRVLGIILLAVLALFLSYNTHKGQKAWQFFVDAKAEVRRVVWPTRPETVQTTMVVVAVIMIMALFLWLVDSLLFYIMSIFTG